MAQPARKPDNAAQPQPQTGARPELLPSSPRVRARVRTGGGGGKQIPFLVDTKLLGDPPPTPARQDRREEMQALLANLGVRKAYVLARDHEPEQIEGCVAAWQEDRDAGADIGPGALAVRIVEWGPPPETSVLEAVVREDSEVAWLEERYERGGKGSLR